jgi:hypothetical protein
MFSKVNSITYILDKESCDEVYRDAKKALESISERTADSESVYNSVLKRMISYKIGHLAHIQLLDILVKSGFLTIIFSSDISFDVSVGIIDNELVYGVLVK